MEMPRKVLLLCALIGLILIGGCAKRNTAWQEPSILSFVREIPVIGNPADISFDADNLYISLDQGGIMMVNTANWQTNWWTQVLPGGADAQLINIRRASLVPQHNLLFLGEFVAAYKIRIVDVSDPDSLRLIDSITGGTDGLSQIFFKAIPNPTDANIIEGFFGAGRSLHYCRYNGSLYLGTTWSIEAPATVSGFDTTDQLVVIAAQQRGLAIYNRANQQKISEIAVPGEALAVKVSGNYAYLACRQGGFYIVDITNPATPVLKDGYDTTGYATSVDIHDNLALVSSGGGGVYVFDVSNPNSIVLKEALTSAGYTNNAIFYEDQVLVSSRDNGVQIYSLDLPGR